MINSHKGGRGYRVAAAIGALTLGVLGAFAVTAPASAAVGPNVNPDTTGTITIHKHEQPAVNGAAGDGTELPTAPANPLAGVVFSVTPVTGINLTTNAGWDAAAAAATALAATGTLPANLGTPTNLAATDADGIATSAQLPLGLYLVQEVSGPANIVSKAAPFLVTVPLPTIGAVPGWNYDIHVYPKNSVGQNPVKTVDDSAAFALGDTVTWTVKAPVPAFEAASELTSFIVTDNLDARLTYAPTATVTLTSASNVDVPLVPADYTLSAGNPVTVTFLAPGLAKLAAAPLGTVTVKIPTTVTGIGDGTIENTALSNVNGNAFTTNEVVTTWAKVKVTKVDSASKAALAGAVFSVFLAETGGTPLVFPSNVTTFTTAADGTVTIPGLKSGVTYYLEEVTAPNGYQGLAARVPAVVNGTTTIEAQVDVEVANTVIPPWQLPLTGGNGALWFGVGGAALVAMAVGGAFVIARRKNAQV